MQPGKDKPEQAGQRGLGEWESLSDRFHRRGEEMNPELVGSLKPIVWGQDHHPPAV